MVYVLYQVQSLLGLPSLSPECIEVQAYLRMSNLQYEIIDVPPSNFENLPALKVDQTIHQRDAIIPWLKANVSDIDAHLSAELRAEVAAFREMIVACLWPALQHFWFVESTNYYRVVRPEIVKYVSFPRSVYYPTLFARNVASSLASQHLSRAKIEARVEACLTAVSDRMGARPYLLGDRPTSADATLFAYLSAMLQPVLPEAFLAHAVEKHTKLMKLFESMRDVHFDGFRTVAPSPTLPAPLLKHSKHSKPRKDDEPLTDEQRSVRRFFMVAGAAVFTYAMLFDVLGVRSALRGEADDDMDADEDGEGGPDDEDDERDGTFDPEDV